MLSEREEKLVLAIQALVGAFTNGACYQSTNPYCRPYVKEALKLVKELDGRECDWMGVFHPAGRYPRTVPGNFRRPINDVCPKCKGQLEYASIDMDGGIPSQAVYCIDCEYEFKDIYRYHHSEEL